MEAKSTYTFEEIELGMEFSISRTISIKQLKDFSDLTGDYHPLHSDEVYARAQSLKGVIVHGMLVSSFSSALIGMHLPGKNMILVSQTFDYLKPVYPNELVLITGTIKRKMNSLKIIFMEVIVKSEENIVAKGEIKLKMRK